MSFPRCFPFFPTRMLAWLSGSAGQGFLLVHSFAQGFFLLALHLALAAILPTGPSRTPAQSLPWFPHINCFPVAHLSLPRSLTIGVLDFFVSASCKKSAGFSHHVVLAAPSALQTLKNCSRGVFIRCLPCAWGPSCPAEDAKK